MADATTATGAVGTVAKDGFDDYYTAKLWTLLPEVYRATTPNGPGVPPVLVGLVRALGGQVAALRRQVDRMWEDQFVELADEWAVREIGGLLGARELPALGARGLRVEAATAAHLRRRRGTPLVLEVIADGLTEWDSAVVEGFTTLTRTWHLLDPAPDTVAGSLRAGPLSGAPRGTTADLRRPLVGELVGTAFDEAGHLVDVRPPGGGTGHYRIDAIPVHLWRRRVLAVTDVDPVRVGPRTWTLDPSGRDVALHAAPRDKTTLRSQITSRRSVAGPVQAAGRTSAWDVPGPLTGRLLDHQEFLIRAADLVPLVGILSANQMAAVRTLVGRRFSSRRELVRHLVSAGVADPEAATWYRTLLDQTLVPECGRALLYSGSLALRSTGGSDRFRSARVQAAALDDPTATPAPLDGGVTGLVDPVLGRAAVLPPSSARPRVLLYHYGVPMPVGAGTDEWQPEAEAGPAETGGGALTVGSGTTRIGDNRTYRVRFAAAPTTRTVLSATSGHRPYALLGTGASPGGRVRPASDDATLVVEGVWLGATDPADLVVADGATPDLHWSRVTLRHTTLDPGGTRADGTTLGRLRLRVEGEVDELVIDRCVLGGLDVVGLVRSVLVRDSVLDARSGGDSTAVDAPLTDVRLERATTRGDVVCNLLEATDTLVSGQVRVTQTQEGCFRFSAADGDSRFPPRYRSWPEPGDDRAVGDAPFASTRFGDPDYLDLHDAAPIGLRHGSEQGEQMGVYESRRLEAKRRGTLTKLGEYAPARVALGLVEAT